MRLPFTHLILPVWLLFPAATPAQGTVQNLTFYSNALGAEEQFQIYLPEGYDPGGAETYPVVYFLHGSTLNSTSYPCLLDSMDALIEAGEIQPMIVVKPDGNQGPYIGSMYTNSSLNGPVEDFIIADLIGYIDANYKTKAERQYRCIFGHSMGAMGSAHLALKHPDHFRAFGAISGALDFRQIGLFFDFALAVEHPGGPPYTYNFNPATHLLTGLIFSAASGYSPRPGSIPPVDFPIDAQGELIDSVMAKWAEFDPALRVVQTPPDPALGIYFDCGQQDEFKFYPMNLGFRDSLDAAGAQYVFNTFQGGHNNMICERMPVAIRYLDSMMLTPIVSAFSLAEPENWTLYPNPCGDEAFLQFEREMPRVITIFDVYGREMIHFRTEKSVEKLDLHMLRPGAYLVRVFDGEGFSLRKLIRQD